MASRTRSPRILVADDEQDLLQIMKDTLEAQGFSVETATGASGTTLRLHPGKHPTPRTTAPRPARIAKRRMIWPSFRRRAPLSGRG